MQSVEVQLALLKACTLYALQLVLFGCSSNLINDCKLGFVSQGLAGAAEDIQAMLDKDIAQASFAWYATSSLMRI